MRNQQPKGKRLVVAVTAGVCALSAAVSQANNDNGGLVLEEVVVTAQKRAETLSDVPISVAVLGEDMLATRGVDTLTDIGANVPNLYVNASPNSPTSVRLFVRGIGQNDVQLTQDPSVALYLDGVYIGTSIGAGFEGVDVDRLEVLRGPQGTLYGRNASGGAVNIVTRRANVEELEFRQSLTGGNRGIFKSNTVVNLPLSDKAAVKLNYFHTQHDGLVENTGPGENFGIKDNDSLVLDVRLEPTEDIIVDYRYEQAKGKSSQLYEQVTEASGGFLSALTETTQVSSERLGSVESAREIAENSLEIDAHSLFLTWEANDDMTVKSISSWREFENDYYSDPLATSVGDYTLLGGGVGSPSYAASRADFEQFSQEIQLIGETESLDYAVGLYYYQNEASQDAVGSMLLATPRSTDLASIENKSLAAFAQVTYLPDFMDKRWSVTVGGRYSKDSRQADRVNYNLVGGGFSASYDKDFTNFTPSITLGFDVTDNANVYGKVVSGFRAGGTSQRSANEALFSEGFEEEDILSYELGYKGSMWNQRARLNLAVFHMELDGLQTSVQTGATPGERDFLPLDGNTIQGFEFDLGLLLAEDLTLSFNYGYLDTELGAESIDSAAGTFMLSDEMSFAPETSYTASLDYSLALDNGALNFNLNYAYKDEVSSSTSAADETIIDDYNVLGAAVSWSDIHLGDTSGSMTLMLWGKNLTDEEYANVAVSSWDIFGAGTTTIFGEPRTIGLTVSYSY